MINMDSLPISGSVIIATISYAAFTHFVSAPIIAERTLERSNWHTQCPAKLLITYQEQQPQTTTAPSLSCASLAGSSSEFSQLCHSFERSPFGQLMNQTLAAKREQLRLAKEQRLAAATQRAQSQCHCAEMVIAKHPSWSLYAGSWRLITPAEIKSLNTTLYQAARSANCGGAL